MNRPAPPVEPFADPGYPPVVQPAASRRTFLAALLGGATAAVADERGARGQGRGLLRVDLVLRRRHVFSGCDLVAERLIVQTRDRQLAAFLGTAAERAGIEAAADPVIRAASCADLSDRKRLAALEARVSRTLCDHYRTRTRRSTALPIVTLVLVKRRPVQLLGDLSVPAAPVPRPT